MVGIEVEKIASQLPGEPSLRHEIRDPLGRGLERPQDEGFLALDAIARNVLSDGAEDGVVGERRVGRAPDGLRDLRHEVRA